MCQWPMPGQARRSRSRLEALAAELRRHPRWRLHIEGHTDPSGPQDLNQRLSLLRARVVAARLERLGVQTERIQTEGRAAADASGPDDRCRRAQISLVGGEP